jgi:hypothetical protein
VHHLANCSGLYSENDEPRKRVAVRNKAWVCSSSTATIGGSNPDEGMKVRLLCLFYVVSVQATATSRSLVQRSYTERARVCVCKCE